MEIGQAGHRVLIQSQMEQRGKNKCVGMVLGGDELPGLNRVQK